MGTQWEDLNQLRAVTSALSSSFPGRRHSLQRQGWQLWPAASSPRREDRVNWGSVGTEAPLSHSRIARSRAWFAMEEGGRVRKQRRGSQSLHLRSLSSITFHPRLEEYLVGYELLICHLGQETELGEKQPVHWNQRRNLSCTEGTKSTSSWVTMPETQNYVDTLYKLLLH